MINRKVIFFVSLFLCATLCISLYSDCAEDAAWEDIEGDLTGQERLEALEENFELRNVEADSSEEAQLFTPTVYISEATALRLALKRVSESDIDIGSSLELQSIVTPTIGYNQYGPILGSQMSISAMEPTEDSSAIMGRNNRIAVNYHGNEGVAGVKEFTSAMSWSVSSGANFSISRSFVSGGVSYSQSVSKEEQLSVKVTMTPNQLTGMVSPMLHVYWMTAEGNGTAVDVPLPDIPATRFNDDLDYMNSNAGGFEAGTTSYIMQASEAGDGVLMSKATLSEAEIDQLLSDNSGAQLGVEVGGITEITGQTPNDTTQPLQERGIPCPQDYNDIIDGPDDNIIDVVTGPTGSVIPGYTWNPGASFAPDCGQIVGRWIVNVTLERTSSSWTTQVVYRSITACGDVFEVGGAITTTWDDGVWYE